MFFPMNLNYTVHRRLCSTIRLTPSLLVLEFTKPTVFGLSLQLRPDDNPIIDLDRS